MRGIIMGALGGLVFWALIAGFVYAFWYAAGEQEPVAWEIEP